MKRYLYALIATVGVTVIVIAAMVSGAIAQTMGEYGAATASTSTGTESAGTESTGTLDTHMPETVWAGASQFPADNQQLSDKSGFPDTDRFSSTDDSSSSNRFGTGDQFPASNELDSGQDRFSSGDARWNQESWGK
ncbi:MAG: hypothetical protein ACREH9_02040 [Pseudomonadota bacterium]